MSTYENLDIIFNGRQSTEKGDEHFSHLVKVAEFEDHRLRELAPDVYYHEDDYRQIGSIPYVYIIYDFTKNAIYVGCQYKKDAHPKMLGTTYFTSSRYIQTIAKNSFTAFFAPYILMECRNERHALYIEECVITALKECYSNAQCYNVRYGPMRDVINKRNLQIRNFEKMQFDSAITMETLAPINDNAWITKKNKIANLGGLNELTIKFDDYYFYYFLIIGVFAASLDNNLLSYVWLTSSGQSKQEKQFGNCDHLYNKLNAFCVDNYEQYKFSNPSLMKKEIKSFLEQLLRDFDYSWVRKGYIKIVPRSSDWKKWNPHNQPTMALCRVSTSEQAFSTVVHHMCYK